MELTLISIGNSRGIRLPKTLIEQLGFEDKVEVKNTNNALILTRPQKKKLHEGWDAQFKKAGAPHDDPEFEAWQNVSNEFDKTEPAWETK